MNDPFFEEAGAAPGKTVYRVADLVRRLKSTLEDELGAVSVEGEISNLRAPPSGHLYFTLKDERAQISAVLFRGDRGALGFEPRDGMQVEAAGRASVYEPRGQLQLILRSMKEAGAGRLRERFEQLKRKLAEEGLFAPERKRPLPILPRCIGLVTSPTGAAIRDILQILDRRFPNRRILVAPVRVQGEGAAEEIAAAMDRLNAFGGVDVMIIGRGGGSLEDLWAFNEECVARACARSQIPVISAVGHEIDFTISDFAADLRAPTPSAAAELVIGRKEDFQNALRVTRRRMARALGAETLRLRARYHAAAAHYVFREPGRMAREYRARLGEDRRAMERALLDGLRVRQQRLDDLAGRAHRRIARETERRRLAVDRVNASLRALSPLAVLERGFSLTRDAAGTIIRDPERVRVGDRLQTVLAGGRIQSIVESRETTGREDADE
jgi:exodeoxyribonuclease VII large subunit